MLYRFGLKRIVSPPVVSSFISGGELGKLSWKTRSYKKQPYEYGVLAVPIISIFKWSRSYSSDLTKIAFVGYIGKWVERILISFKILLTFMDESVTEAEAKVFFLMLSLLSLTVLCA